MPPPPPPGRGRRRKEERASSNKEKFRYAEDCPPLSPNEWRLDYCACWIPRNPPKPPKNEVGFQSALLLSTSSKTCQKVGGVWKYYNDTPLFLSDSKARVLAYSTQLTVTTYRLLSVFHPSDMFDLSKKWTVNYKVFYCVIPNTIMHAVIL